METTFKTTTQDFSRLRALTAAGKATGAELIDMNESDYAACQKGKQELATLCTPATVIALLDALDALQAEVKHLNLHLKATQSGRDAALARLAELPDTCDGKEQEAFEAYAVGEKLNMQCHPLHYLFLNGEPYAARQSWKAAILYCRKQVDASAGASPAEPNFCESCAMGLSTCDCVTPRPADRSHALLRRLQVGRHRGSSR